MKKRKLRIAVLIHKGLLPPPSKNGYTNEQVNEWKVEYDVISTLKKSGHEVIPVEMMGELEPLREAIDDSNPHIAFNLLEEFIEYPLFDQQVINYLELKKIPYTGCNPRGLILSKDKALSKKILVYHKISVPAFYVFPKSRKLIKNHFSYPLFVKPLNEEGSTGISKDSVVNNQEELKSRVGLLQSNFNTDVIAEQFIKGREIFMGVIGNKQLITLPPWELILENDNSASPIFTSKLKWNIKHQKEMGLKTGKAKLSKKEAAKFSTISKEIYKALKLSGYARMDYKFTPDGEIYLIEANPNPFLAKDEDFALSAKHTGLSYSELIDKLLLTGLNYKPF